VEWILNKGELALVRNLTSVSVLNSSKTFESMIWLYGDRAVESLFDQYVFILYKKKICCSI